MPIVTRSYSDHPATEDELGFAPSVAALLDIINDTDLPETPLTIGIYGPWGSGKTSLMHMIHARLNHEEMTCIPIQFEAWRYAQADILWRAFLLSIIEELRFYLLSNDDTHLKSLLERRQRINAPTTPTAPSAAALEQEHQRLKQQLDDLVASLYRSVEREEVGNIEVNWGEAGKLAARTALRIGFSFIPVLGTLTKAVEEAHAGLGGESLDKLVDIFQRQRSHVYSEQVRSLEQFYRSFRTLLKEWVLASNLHLVVFIDDLDRCLPEQAVGVLEAIKVFLDVQGCIFVLGMDRAVIERGIRVRYKEFALDEAAAQRAGQPAAIFPIAGRDYLEKIVQVPFELPPLDPADIQKFLHTRLQAVTDLQDQSASIATVMTAGLLPNPRKVKRTLNTFRLVWSLGQKHNRTFSPPLLAKLIVIQSSAPALYDRSIERPSDLPRLEKVARRFESDHELKTLLDQHPRIAAMLTHAPYFETLTDTDLHNLIFLTRTTQDRPMQ